MDRERMSERQAEIVEAATRLLATKGARRFTVQLLADEIGVTGGAIYRHFEGMDEVMSAVVERIGAVLFEGFPPAAEDPLERLRLFFHQRTSSVLAHPHISRLLLSDHLAQAAGKGQVARLEEFKQRSRTFVRDCLQEAERNGLLTSGMSAEAGAVVVLGSILALAHTRVSGGSTLDRLSEEVWSGLERMLRGPISARGQPKVRASGGRR